MSERVPQVRKMTEPNVPLIQPDRPWHIAALAGGGGERPFVFFERPEEERVVGVAVAVDGDVAREAACQWPCYVRQRLGDLEVCGSWSGVSAEGIQYFAQRGATYNSAMTRRNRSLAYQGTHAANCSWWEPGQPQAAGQR